MSLTGCPRSARASDGSAAKPIEPFRATHIKVSGAQSKQISRGHVHHRQHGPRCPLGATTGRWESTVGDRVELGLTSCLDIESDSVGVASGTVALLPVSRICLAHTDAG